MTIIILGDRSRTGGMRWLCCESIRSCQSRMISETQDSLLASDESEMFITRRDVTQVQISWRVGQALVSAWDPALLSVLREILELKNPKIDWNGRKFDRPILRDMGIRTDIGEWHDLMDGWHHAQPDLPRGLQFATSFSCPEVGPWKHLSHSDALWYGALDVDMPQRIFGDLKSKLGGIVHPLSGISLWTGYCQQVVALAPVLDRMSARGIGVDEDRRLKLDEEFTATLGRLTEENARGCSRRFSGQVTRRRGLFGRRMRLLCNALVVLGLRGLFLKEPRRK